MGTADWLNSTGSLIAAVGGLLAGIAVLWPQVRLIRNFEKGRSILDMPRLRRVSWILGIALTASSAGIFGARMIIGQAAALNEDLMSQAWNAYNKGDFGSAIRKAEALIDEFRGAADRRQAELQKNRGWVFT